MLDDPAPADEIRRNFGDMARLNALFGGRRLTLLHARRLLRRLPPGRTATVLDLGTGGADVPRALVRWARRAGRPIRVWALDRDLTTLGLAREASSGYPEIRFLAGDVRALPVPPGAVDVAISALTLHHLAPEAARAHLAGMEEVARLGFVVNDLHRSRAAWLAVWVATRLLARSPMSRHDGPLSVLRAYTPAEVRALCTAAGLAGVVVHRYPVLSRQCAVRVKP
jgi:SAM-dependent methyltransferase